MKKYFISILIIIALVGLFGSVAIAQTTTSTSDLTGLVHCDNSTAHPCNFNALMELVNTIINFLLFALALPIAAIMCAYAGFKLVISAGSSEERTSAKKIFTSAIIGFIIALAAWLIVETILSILGYNGAWIGFPLLKI